MRSSGRAARTPDDSNRHSRCRADQQVQRPRTHLPKVDRPAGNARRILSENTRRESDPVGRRDAPRALSTADACRRRRAKSGCLCGADHRVAASALGASALLAGACWCGNFSLTVDPCCVGSGLCRLELDWLLDFCGPRVRACYSRHGCSSLEVSPPNLSATRHVIERLDRLVRPLGQQASPVVSQPSSASSKVRLRQWNKPVQRRHAVYENRGWRRQSRLRPAAAPREGRSSD